MDRGSFQDLDKFSVIADSCYLPLPSTSMGTPAEKPSALCHSALGYRPPAPEGIEVIPRDPGGA